MKVLLIEDSETCQVTFRQALEECPHKVHLDCVGTFTEGLRVAGDYDAIVVDLNLPDLSITTENLNAVVESLPDLPRIAFTGTEDVDLCYQLGIKGIGLISKSPAGRPLIYEIVNQMGQFERRQQLRTEVQRLRGSL